ncbi:T9SS type A sorting domain-containing protein [uncultured Marixanthomonas sp.]|uniref:T9SS type A sorting domain-containing protein n=1 Tax=uncultured Marixanthomonas sp. TaxID=757245 RepID=UPI0030DDD7F4|tara:strand:+ start:228560 stop:229336 length:777 start_codon:yes stop_codon:yes gene_type:complete
MKTFVNLKLLLGFVFIFNLQAMVTNPQSSMLYAQDPDLFEHTWYLEKVNVGGEEYLLADYYTAETPITEFNNQNPSMHSSLCEFMCFWATCSFDTEENIMNLSEYETCVLTGECTAESPELYTYRDLYFSIFYTPQTSVINNPFTYTIEPIDNYQQLTITNGEGDWAVYNSVFLSTTDFNDTSFSIYPNPTKENLNINNPLNQTATVTIYDVSGKKLQSHILKNSLSTINTKALRAGLYFVIFENEAGKRVSKRFIKK